MKSPFGVCPKSNLSPGSRFYETFVSLCEDQREKPLTQKCFGGRLTTHGFTVSAALEKNRKALLRISDLCCNCCRIPPDTL